MASLLIEHGVDVNSGTNLGWRPITLLSEFSPGDDVGQRLMMTLLANGADPTLRDSEGHSGLDYARKAGKGLDLVIKSFMEKKEMEKALPNGPSKRIVMDDMRGRKKL